MNENFPRDTSGSHVERLTSRTGLFRELQRITGRSLEGSAPDPLPAKRTVYLLIDTSGSMAEGNKLEQARMGAIDFVNDARAKGYCIGLIQFGSSAHEVLAPSRCAPTSTAAQGLIKAALQTMSAAGSTNMAAALHFGTAKLGRNSTDKCMCVVTDGQPDSVEDAIRAADEAKRMGIRVLTIGTDDADVEFLKRIATHTTLAIVVPRTELEAGIRSMAKLLPAASRSGEREVRRAD